MKKSIRYTLLATASILMIAGGAYHAFADIDEDIDDSCQITSAGVTCYDSDEGTTSGTITFSEATTELNTSLNSILLGDSTSLEDNLEEAIETTMAAMDEDIASAMQNAVTAAVTNVAESLNVLVEEGAITLKDAVKVLSYYMSTIVQQVNDIDADAELVAARTDDEISVDDIKQLLAFRYAQKLIESSIEVTTVDDDEDDDDTGVKIVTKDSDDDDDDDDDDDRSSSSSDGSDDDTSTSPSSSDDTDDSSTSSLFKKIMGVLDEDGVSAPVSSTTPGETAFNIDRAALANIKGDKTLTILGASSKVDIFDGDIGNDEDYKKFTQVYKCPVHKCPYSSLKAPETKLLVMWNNIEGKLQKAGYSNLKFTLNSGYRSEDYNNKVATKVKGYVPRHVYAQAGDLTVCGTKNNSGSCVAVPLTEFQEVAFLETCESKGGNIVRYPTFVHVASEGVSKTKLTGKGNPSRFCK